MGLLKCKECNSELCHNCIQLETHSCSMFDKVKNKYIEKLMNENPQVVAPKIYKF
jgi:hypothetical protein